MAFIRAPGGLFGTDDGSFLADLGDGRFRDGTGNIFTQDQLGKLGGIYNSNQEYSDQTWRNAYGPNVSIDRSTQNPTIRDAGGSVLFQGSNPSASGLLGLTPGDMLSMAGMAAGAYGLGNGGFLPGGEVGGSASAGASAAPGGYNPMSFVDAATLPPAAGMPAYSINPMLFADAPTLPSTMTPDFTGGISVPGGGGLPSASTAASGASSTKSILDQTKDAAKAAAPFAPLLGAAVGASAGALGGGTRPAGSITIQEGIPDWLKPYAQPALDKYSTMVQNYNTDPYGIMPSAMQEFQKTISGQYLDPSTNKYLPEYFRLGAERLKGTLSPSFGYMQAFGGNSGYNEALSRGLGDLAVGLYGGAYEKERQRQNDLISAAPSFLTGSEQTAFAPYSSYLSTISSLGKQKDQPYFDNPMGNILGGALAGYGLGSIFK